MKTKSINKMKNTTLKMMMIAITGLFLVSLNSVAHAAERESYDAVNQCVSWDKFYNFRVIKNNCDFDIAVWFCSKKSTYDCGNGSNNFFGSLTHVEPYGTYRIGTSIKDGVRWLACGADGVSGSSWHISGNTPNSNRFGCYNIY